MWTKGVTELDFTIELEINAQEMEMDREVNGLGSFTKQLAALAFGQPKLPKAR